MVEAKDRLENNFPDAIALIIDPYKLAINRGTEHGIRIGQRFLVYNLSEEEILDPITNESLGYLEIVKGTGKVIHVQEKMATIESDQTEVANRTITRKKHPYIPSSVLGDTVEEIVSPRKLPFDSAQLGDMVKPI